VQGSLFTGMASAFQRPESGAKEMMAKFRNKGHKWQIITLFMVR